MAEIARLGLDHPDCPAGHRCGVHGRRRTAVATTESDEVERMRRFLVYYSYRKDKRSSRVETREAECVQWSDGSVYMNGPLTPGDFMALQDFEKVMSEHYVHHEIGWIDKPEEERE